MRGSASLATIEEERDRDAAGHLILERMPQILLAAVPAHPHEGVEGLGNDGIAGVKVALTALERSDQHTMGGRDIPVDLQQGHGCGGGGLEGSLDLGVTPPQLREHL
jgi:hypothetical protein